MNQGTSQTMLGASMVRVSNISETSFESVLSNATTRIQNDPMQQSSLLDGLLHRVLTIVCYHVLQIPVTAFGIVTNILNIVIFKSSGLKDSVSLSFLALSVSDLGYCIIFCMVRTIDFLISVYPRIDYKNMRIIFFTFFYGAFFQDVSLLITVFVVIQKCCCVSIPYLFKNVFTPTRTIVTIVTFTLSMLAAYMPLLAGLEFVSVSLPPLFNQTTLTLRRTPMYFSGLKFWMVFNKIILTAFSQGVINLCLIIMVVQLRKSTKFRQETASEVATAESSTSSDVKKSTLKLGYKERRAVTAVAIVSFIFVVSTLPAVLLSYAQLIATEFFNSPRNKSLLYLFEQSQNIPIHVSASINIFVYLKYNTKFRETAKVIFKRLLYRDKADLERKDVS